MRRAAQRRHRGAKLRAPIGVIHDEGTRAAKLMPERKCRADRTAGVAGRRLHVDASKRRYSPDLAVGDRVHGAAAGEREIGRAGSAVCSVLDQMEECLLVHGLHRAGDVAMPILERRRRDDGAVPEAPRARARTDRQIPASPPSIDRRSCLRVMAEIVEIELRSPLLAGALSGAFPSCMRARHKGRAPSPCTRRHNAETRDTASAPDRRCQASAENTRDPRS